MKRKLSIVSMICVACAALPMSALNVSAANTTVNASLSNTDFQVAQDQDFTTTIYVPQNSNVSAFEAVLDYDASAVTLKSAKACTTDSGTIEVNPKDGKIYISFSATGNQTEQINVVDLTFHVVDDLAAGSYSILSLDGKGTNNASSESESGTATDYKLTSQFSDMSIYQFGDADLNGKVQSRDVSYIKQYVVKLRDMTDLSKTYANAYMDFEDDGTTPKVNSRDAGIIQQKVVKMDVTLGNRANVTFYGPDGSVYAQKSIKVGSAWDNIPDLPALQGYEDAKWSLKPDEYVAVDFSKITTDTDVYYCAAKDPNRIICDEVIAALEDVFAQEGKLINGDFKLPYKSGSNSYNMPAATKKYDNVDVTWSIDSGTLASSLNTIDYVFKNPNLEYTTWVTFNAHIYIDGVKYEIHPFKREIQGKIDMPSPTKFQEIINSIPKELPEHYRLPGYVSLESERKTYGVNTVQNVDIQWSVVKSENGTTADKRVLDTTNNEIIYLKDETDVTLQCDFVFEGNVIYTDRITGTIPAKSIEGQVEYAEQYIKSFVPSIISGETYFPTTVPLYDLTVSWIPDIESGKVDIGANETVNGTTYKVINVGEKAGYMEWAKVYANIERNGDDTFKRTGLEFDVQLAGNSTEISTDKIPDVNLYNTLLNIFDKKYGNKDGILTEEEIYDTKVMEKLGYELDLSNKGIRCLSGIKYLKYYKKIDLSNNDLSGENAGLGELASLNYLEQLSLSNCGISEIPSSVFSSKFLIEGIDLSYNKLKDVNFLTLTDSRTQVEQPFTELKELFLQGNYISDISNLSFVNDSGELVSRIPNVTILTLSRDLNYYEYTKGAKLGKQVFKPIEEYDYDIHTPMDIAPIGLMKNLTTLWLANNSITDISPLENCTLLTTLDLSNNNISSTISTDGLEPLARLQSLVCLRLDYNDIHTVKSLRRLIYLEILSLSNNHIGSVQGTLDSLSMLTYLDLDNNELTSFDAGSFNNLQRLFLESQGYNTDDGFVNTLELVSNLNQATDIVELRLNNNNIDNNSVQSISNLKKLEYLSLSGNSVVDLGFLQDLVYLTHLELARCNIRQAREVNGKDQSTGETISEQIDNLSYLSGMKDLLILDLSDNPEIHNIASLSTLTKLSLFYMNNVELESAAAVRSMTKLQYLSMQNSGLTDFSFLNTLNQLEYLNLAGHKFAAFDFRNIKNYDNLVGLFLDSATETEAININTFVNKQNLRYMALANVNVGSVDSLPDMDNITYLGLRNANISDFNGSYSETDGYIYPITRFKTLKYLDVADNPELFTKKNLEMLYDFVGKPEQPISIILYSENAPEGYVPGLMNPDIEAKRIKNDIDFGEGGTDITAAASAGYSLQSKLNEYDIQWKLSENDSYTVKDGKLYFKNSDKIDENTKLSLTMDIMGLYYRESNPNTQASTPVTFNASIKTTTKQVPTGEKKFVKRDTTTSNSESLEGWIPDPDNPPEYGYTNYGEWSDWSTNAVSENDLRQVETKQESGYSDWGGWSDWSTSAVSGGDLRQVETKTEQYVASYDMGFFSTRTTGGQRQFRNFSVNGEYEKYGLSRTYGEYNNWPVITVSPDELNNATVIPPGGSQGGSQNGVNKAEINGYSLPWYDGIHFIFFIANTNYGNTTYYRYRDRSTTSTTYYRYRDRTKVPTVYHFYKDIYEDIMKDEISGMTLVVEK